MDSQIIRNVEHYTELIKNIVDIKMVVLYGSASRGENSEFSDIDVAVIVEDLDEDYLTLSSKLVEMVYTVDPRIEPTLLSKKYNKSGFIDSVIKSGLVVYAA